MLRQSYTRSGESNVAKQKPSLWAGISTRALTFQARSLALLLQTFSPSRAGECNDEIIAPTFLRCMLPLGLIHFPEYMDLSFYILHTMRIKVSATHNPVNGCHIADPTSKKENPLDKKCQAIKTSGNWFDRQLIHFLSTWPHALFTSQPCFLATATFVTRAKPGWICCYPGSSFPCAHISLRYTLQSGYKLTTWSCTTLAYFRASYQFIPLLKIFLVARQYSHFSSISASIWVSNTQLMNWKTKR